MDHSSNEENPRGVATGEGEVVSGNDGVHGGIVVRVGATDDELDEADEGKAEEERSEVGMVGGTHKEEREGDGEEEAKIKGAFKEEEEGVRKE